jgi:hypothetical protein
MSIPAVFQHEYSRTVKFWNNPAPFCFKKAEQEFVPTLLKSNGGTVDDWVTFPPSISQRTQPCSETF